MSLHLSFAPTYQALFLKSAIAGFRPDNIPLLNQTPGPSGGYSIIEHQFAPSYAMVISKHFSKAFGIYTSKSIKSCVVIQSEWECFSKTRFWYSTVYHQLQRDRVIERDVVKND